jgi:hypothetical protein
MFFPKVSGVLLLIALVCGIVFLVYSYSAYFASRENIAAAIGYNLNAEEMHHLGYDSYWGQDPRNK